MNDFFSMGGYGFYVWGSYGVTALFMLIELLRLRQRRRHLLQSLRRMKFSRTMQAQQKVKHESQA